MLQTMDRVPPLYFLACKAYHPIQPVPENHGQRMGYVYSSHEEWVPDLILEVKERRFDDVFEFNPPRYSPAVWRVAYNKPIRTEQMIVSLVQCKPRRQAGLETKVSWNQYLSLLQQFEDAAAVGVPIETNWVQQADLDLSCLPIHWKLGVLPNALAGSWDNACWLYIQSKLERMCREEEH